VDPTNGILKNFIEYADAITEASREYLLLAGVMLLSSIVQDLFHFVEADQRAKLNIYCILCGSSTETKKTTAPNIPRRLIQRQFEGKDGRRVTLPSRTTAEALQAL
jgi:hypothetical protein